MEGRNRASCASKLSENSKPVPNSETQWRQQLPLIVSKRGEKMVPCDRKISIHLEVPKMAYSQIMLCIKLMHLSIIYLDIYNTEFAKKNETAFFFLSSLVENRNLDPVQCPLDIT